MAEFATMISKTLEKRWGRSSGMQFLLNWLLTTVWLATGGWGKAIVYISFPSTNAILA